MRINKSNAIASAIVLFSLGALLFVFLFGLTLFTWQNPPVGLPGEMKISLPPFQLAWQNGILFFFLPLLSILCIERGIYNTKRGIAIRKDELGGTASLLHSFGTYFKLSDFVSYIIFALIFLALIVFDISVLARSHVAFTANSLIFLIGIAVYILIRKKLNSGLKTASKKLKKNLPAYTLLENGIQMRLFPVGKGPAATNPPPVTIYFDELDEVKVLNDIENKNYVKYTIGPDLELSKRMVADEIRYLKGEIPRPSVYRTRTGTNCKSVLLRGKGLFYLVTFNTDDVEGIETAFNGHHKTKQENAPRA